MRSRLCLLAMVAVVGASGCSGGADDKGASAGGSAAGGGSAVDGGGSAVGGGGVTVGGGGVTVGGGSVRIGGGGVAVAGSGATDGGADGGSVASGGGGAGATPGPIESILQIFGIAFGSSDSDEDYDEGADLDGDGIVGLRDYAMAKRALAGLNPDPRGEGAGGGAGTPPPYQAARPFSNSADCKFCHPRQFNEWRTSPHAYSGISPTFYSLVAAGQNSFGAGYRIDDNNGISQAGAVGNFCLPCHAPMAFIGLEGRYGGNNAGFADAQPVIPFVCAPSSPNPLAECTNQTALADCGAAGACIQFEGRTCANMPAQNPNTLFPRVLVHCTDDLDCAAGNNGCSSGGGCGPCVIAPATNYYFAEAQEGINCEACHNMLPNHQRSCQIFRESDSVGVLSIDIAERSAEADGRRLRLGPYPVADISNGQGVPGDQMLPVLNAFHESARVDSPLVVAYDQTDRRDGVANPQASPHILRPTALTCEELPYCARGFCQGGPLANAALGTQCSSDRDCGGCGFDGAANTCGAASARADLACENSVDCAAPINTSDNLFQRGIDDPTDETVAPLTRRDVSAAGELDRADGNFYRSSMLCAACHDVRPPFVNASQKSCQEQPSHVCRDDGDCLNLNVGCSGNDCGPCVAENASKGSLPGTPQSGTAAVGDPRNAGYRRVENLFSEWQLSLYNHPELTFCQGNSFRACTVDADCLVGGFDEGPCDVTTPYVHPVDGPLVITCQDCHMSNFPTTPLIDFSGGAPGVVRGKNELYSQDLAALEGSQSNPNQLLPVRRVSTHFMSGVDLPLVKYPGQQLQAARRQQLIDAGFKITVVDRPVEPVAGQEYHVEVTVENVGVGHRFPAGFSHERQNWLQVFVQDLEKLQNLGIELDPFADNAPCHLQRTIATSAEDSRDPVGAAALANAGCIFRSGFQLDKAHPETGEMVPDGSLDDEDPEDFFVVAGTRVLGQDGDDRTGVQTQGAEGRALSIRYICAEETEQTYRASIAAGSGIDMGTNLGFPFQVRFCDPALTPSSGPGHTAPGFGNPDCMDSGVDVGPCVPEVELSDGNERGRCANDLARPSCQSDLDCGSAGPCLYRCSNFPELECCDETDPTCAQFYTDLFGSPNHECELDSLACAGGANNLQPCVLESDCPGGACQETEICLGGPRSGLACSVGTDCPVSNNCGDAGQCRIENTGIVNFQNQFRTSANGVCVDPNDAREPSGEPKPVLNGGEPVGCFLNLTCTLQGFGGNVCLINGQCSGDSASPGAACTNVTYRTDCPGGTCNVEFNLELNGRPSESVFIQNHPFNFNSMAPFQPRTFDYDFEVPSDLVGKQLLVSARLMNRHFPMRFVRNLIGTQAVRPPYVIEAQGNPSDPSQCNELRTIDIDCFMAPVITLGNAEPGGFVPANQTVRTDTITVQP